MNKLPTREDLDGLMNAVNSIVMDLIENIGLLDTFEKTEMAEKGLKLLAEIAPDHGKLLAAYKTIQSGAAEWDVEAHGIVTGLLMHIYKRQDEFQELDTAINVIKTMQSFKNR